MLDKRQPINELNEMILMDTNQSEDQRALTIHNQMETDV